MIIPILQRTILFCSFIAAGYIAEAQFTYGPQINAGITNALQSGAPAITDGVNSTIKTTSKANANINVGLEVAYQFDQYWTVNSGVFYQYIQPTFKQNTSPSTTITDKISYINIPLEIVHINDALKKGWYYGIGANFGLGVAGNDTRATDGIAQTVHTSIKFDGEKDANDNYTHLNFLNMGALLKVGYFFGKTFIGGEANLGLSNIAPNNNSRYKINTYSIHIGYMFGKKKTPVAAAVPKDVTP
ncbi:MAG TPA: outer membrane beta-barrel protein [Ferruginibacter sp.]|nr:outer membrane beta-barrel protein [Ferruginibacter sp.]